MVIIDKYCNLLFLVRWHVNNG